MTQPTLQQLATQMLLVDELDDQVVVQKFIDRGIPDGQARDAVRKVRFEQKRQRKIQLFGTPKEETRLKKNIRKVKAVFFFVLGILLFLTGLAAFSTSGITRGSMITLFGGTGLMISSLFRNPWE